MVPKRNGRSALAFVAIALLVCASVTAAAPAGSRMRGPIVKTKRIAPGLVYRKIVQRSIPRRTFVLRMDPSEAVTLDTTLTEGQLPARRVLSAVARQHDALAAVNGDYSGNPVGDPVHPFAQDGELLQTTGQLGVLFAMTADESRTFFGRPDIQVSLRDLTSALTIHIDRWNDGPPAVGEIATYSPLGGTLELPPAYACSVRLLPEGSPRPADGDGVDRDYVVDLATCQSDALARSGGIVISTPPATKEAIQLLALAPGTAMRLHWTFGWSEVLDAVGGAPLLLEDGRIVGRCKSGCGRQPRTGIGVTAGGDILLVVVDGRQSRWSLGPTAIEFARIMRDLGAVTALNLDGGGSSEMVVQGEVVNRPSDGNERPISNAILVLRGPDPGEDRG